MLPVPVLKERGERSEARRLEGWQLARRPRPSFETQTVALRAKLAPQDEARETGNDRFHGIER
jgi:hypothetical protein